MSRPLPPIRVLGDGDPALPRIAAELAAIERAVTYPLGADRFRIDHGADYFAFFRRLGAVRVAVAERDDRVVGVLVGTLRELPTRGGGVRRAWYLGDLKVDPAHPVPGLGRALLAAFECDARGAAAAGFAVSMDPAHGGNPLVRAARCWQRGLHAGPTLEIHTVDRAGFARLTVALRPHRGALGLETLTGIKDIVLASTGRPMPLWHVRPGRDAATEPGPGPAADAVCMLCAPRGGPLAATLAAAGSVPTATATVLQRGLDDADWSSFSTAEI